MAVVLASSACQHEAPLSPLDDTGLGGYPGGGGTIEEPEQVVTCSPTTVWYQQQIQPLLISNCTMGNGCHSSATDDNDDIDLTSYAALMNSGIVQDGDLWEAINDDDVEDRMPQAPQAPLTQAQIDLIGLWIQQGAQNNSCEPTACDTLNVTYSGTIRPVIEARCQGCHSGATPQGGLDFSSWSVLNAVANDGRLAASIQHEAGVPAMPPSGSRLSDCRIEQFLIWIEAGAPNN
ncbi:MAG: hypothetical protein ACO1NQ_05640 [Flavobacteriales bacterium]